MSANDANPTYEGPFRIRFLSAPGVTRDPEPGEWERQRDAVAGVLPTTPTTEPTDRKGGRR